MTFFYSILKVISVIREGVYLAVPGAPLCVESNQNRRLRVQNNQCGMITQTTVTAFNAGCKTVNPLKPNFVI